MLWYRNFLTHASQTFQPHVVQEVTGIGYCNAILGRVVLCPFFSLGPKKPNVQLVCTMSILMAATVGTLTILGSRKEVAYPTEVCSLCIYE